LNSMSLNEMGKLDMNSKATTPHTLTELAGERLKVQEAEDEEVIAELKQELQITSAHNKSDVYLSPTLNLAELLFGSSVPLTLDYEIVLLKRKQDTLDMHARFSATQGEGENQVLERISVARKEARKIQAFTCITEYIFAEPRVDVHFFYDRFLKETREATRAPSFIDVGCCVGTDIRKMIYDGLAPSNITGLDIESRFYNIGLSLFNQTPRSFGIRFVQADILSVDFYTRYAHLAGQFDYVHSANVIHLFDADTQHRFAQVLSFLCKPGGIIWGRQVGESDDSATRGLKIEGKGHRFTANEFRRMWLDSTGWDQIDIEFESRLVRYEEMRLLPEYKRNSLEWVVKVPSAAAFNRKFLQVEEIKIIHEEI